MSFIGDKCPCGECVCFAICRTKNYDLLVQHCDIVSEYIFEHGTGFIHITRCKILEKTLNPTKWKLGKQTDHGSLELLQLVSFKGKKIWF